MQPRPRQHRRRRRDYLGELGAGLEGYPFGEMTQVYKYRADVGANWKLFIDAFAEFYHAPVLHAKQAVADESRKLAGLRLRGARLRASTARTAWCRRGAACRRPRTSSMVKPIERVLRSGLFGPWDRPDIEHRRAAARRSTRPGTRRGASTRSCSSRTSCCWCGRRAGTSRTTTGRRPTTSHIFEGTLYFVPPKNATRAPAPGARRGDVQGVRAPGRQHPRGHPAHASSRGPSPTFPLNDQEILLRHLHKTARDRVADAPGAQGETPVRISAAS